MPSARLPDLEAWRKESEQQRKAGTKHRDAFMWPYINQEDLTKPRTLLLFLHTRGRNHPSRFASADREAMHIGHVTQAVVPTFLNTYVVILNGVTNRQRTPNMAISSSGTTTLRHSIG